MIALNSAMAEALQNFKQRVDAKIDKGDSKVSAILDVLRDDIKTCKPIRFDGNGYSEAWVKEAASRGLDVEKSCPKIIMNHIIPVSTHYQSQLIKNVQGMKAVFPEEQANRLSARNMKLIQEIAERTERIEQFVEELTDARRVANRIQSIHERAIAYHDTVCPKMDAIRSEIDHLEMIVEDGLWSLPKYRELLFIR